MNRIPIAVTFFLVPASFAPNGSTSRRRAFRGQPTESRTSLLPRPGRRMASRICPGFGAVE